MEMARKVRVNLMPLIRRKEDRLKLDRRLTNREIGDAVGLSEQAVGRWLRGDVRQVNFDLLERFCTYFECEVNDLLVLEEEPLQPAEN
jgi:putative transcriptional regulator